MPATVGPCREPVAEMALTEKASPHVLIVGSAPARATHLQTLALASDVIVCADGGGDAVLLADLMPAVVLGDMDSISNDTRSRLANAGVVFQTHPTDKDKTDLELALDYALSLRPSRITIAGALGGIRLDHTIGNLMLLTLPSLRDIDTRIEDEAGVAFAVTAHRQFAGSPGDYVSLLPLTERVEGIATEGLRYALHGETLRRGSTRGISNELDDAQASITVSAGLLLVRHEHRAVW